MKIIRIDGVVGDWLNTGEEFQWQLAELALDTGEELMIILNSVGGSVIDGFSIYNQIKGLDNPTTVKIEGFAASIAALIAMAADKVQMSEVGQFMIHRSHVSLQGDKNELEKQAEILKSVDATQIQVFSEKTGLSSKEIEKMLDAETWMTASAAKDHGFIDEIVDKINSKMAANYLLTINSRKMNLKKLLSQLAGTQEEEKVEVIEANTEKVAEAAEPVTREEFNELKTILADLVAGLSAQEEATAEAVDTDEAKKAEAEKAEAKKAEAEKTEIEKQVVEKFEALVKGLPTSKGQPTAANKTFSETPKHTDKFAAFRAEQKEIENNTRLQ